MKEVSSLNYTFLVSKRHICKTMNISVFKNCISVFFFNFSNTEADPYHQKYIENKAETGNKTLLWLDDRLNPMEDKMDWLSLSPIGRTVDVVWVKNFFEFQSWIQQNGLPNAICFDYDLGKKEPTGYDCAKWLVNFCREHEAPLPNWASQSTHPVEKAKIKKLLKNYTVRKSNS